MNNSGKILTAFAAGAAMGAILGVLFAPDKGTETRKKISEAGKKVAEGFENTIKKGKEKAEAMKEKMEEYA